MRQLWLCLLLVFATFALAVWPKLIAHKFLESQFVDATAHFMIKFKITPKVAFKYGKIVRSDRRW